MGSAVVAAPRSVTDASSKGVQMGTICSRAHAQSKRHTNLHSDSPLGPIFCSLSCVWFDSTSAWLRRWVFPNEMRVFSDDFAAAMSERAAHPLFEYQSCNFSNWKLFGANCILLTD